MDTFLFVAGIVALIIFAIVLITFALMWLLDELMYRGHPAIATIIMVIVFSMSISALYMVFLSTR